MIELAPMSENNMTYDEAVLYCQFLEYNGHTDWRLPTYDEYQNAEHNIWGWFLNRDRPNSLRWRVCPVRDV
jgi:hypothetical protein